MILNASPLPDPARRNLLITQCYHQLSAQMAGRTGPGATWCTFATWASKQAGQTIRKEDLLRHVESRLRLALLKHTALDALLQAARLLGMGQDVDLAGLVIELSGLSLTVQRSSAAVGRGNQKVFAEIGREFARFFAECLDDETPDAEKLARFCQALRPGDPPEGQRYLQQAFSHYYQAFFEPETKMRLELSCWATWRSASTSKPVSSRRSPRAWKPHCPARAMWPVACCAACFPSLILNLGGGARDDPDIYTKLIEGCRSIHITC